MRNPLEVSYEMDVSLTQVDEPEEDGNGITHFLYSLFSGDDDGDSVIAAFPSFVDDDLDSIDVSGYGASGTILIHLKCGTIGPKVESILIKGTWNFTMRTRMEAMV